MRSWHLQRKFEVGDLHGEIYHRSSKNGMPSATRSAKPDVQALPGVFSGIEFEI